MNAFVSAFGLVKDAFTSAFGPSNISLPTRIGLLAEYLMNEGSGSLLSNNAAANPASAKNILYAPESAFSKSYYWVSTGVTVTDDYADAPVTGYRASRLVASGVTKYIAQSRTVTNGANYTASVWAKSNTGVAQSMRILRNGTLSSDKVLDATAWTRISENFTASSASANIGFGSDAAGTALDVSIWGTQLEAGSLTDYVPSEGHLVLVGSPAWSAAGVTFGSGKWGFGPIKPVAQTVGTCHVVMTWPTGSAAGVQGGLLLTETIGISSNDNSNTYPQVYFSGYSPAYTANLHDGLPHLVTGVYDDVHFYLYIDGVLLMKTASSKGTPTLSTLLMGHYFPGIPAWAFTGTIHYTSVYSTAQTANDVAAVRASLASYLANRVSLTTLSTYIAWEGDSIVATTSPIGYPIVTSTLSPIKQGRTFAVSGSTMADLNSRAASVDATYVSGANNILFVGDGRNDMSTGLATTFVADLKAYCLARKAVGWKVVVATVLPSTLLGFNTKRNAANVLIVADTSFYDALARFDLDATMGPDAAASNTTYYSDGTHPTAAGHVILAPIAKAAIESV